MKQFTHVLAIVLIAIGIALPASCKVTKGYASSSDNTLTFNVDSIDSRKDLIRVYGTLNGRPHTSHRIDAISMVANGNALECTDIDGVDFNRYFQWEDNGMIPIELDFPSLKGKRINEGVIEFTTPRGKSVTNFKYVVVKKKK